MLRMPTPEEEISLRKYRDDLSKLVRMCPDCGTPQIQRVNYPQIGEAANYQCRICRYKWTKSLED
jgi:rubredoxin